MGGVADSRVAWWPDDPRFSVCVDMDRDLRQVLRYDPLWDLPSWDWLGATDIRCFHYLDGDGVMRRIVDDSPSDVRGLVS